MSNPITTDSAYWSKDVSKNLGIGDSTLRKWCLALENEGYKFIKGQNDRRAFLDKDIINLRHFQKLVHEQRITMEDASKIIVSSINHQEGTTSVPTEQPIPPEPKNNFMTLEQGNEIIERLHQQEQFNKALLEQLNKQQKYIEETLNKRDQHLMEALRESQETKKLIAAATEKIEQQQEKKNWFSSLFKKNKGQ